MRASSRIFALTAAAMAFAFCAIGPTAAQPASFDFGDDSGAFPRDGECDDVRLEGSGVSVELVTDEIGRDATDCRAAFANGSVRLNPLFVRPANVARIIFGDDASDFALDGECDDIRFVHAGSAETIYLTEDIGHDAADCKAGFDAGLLRWQGDSANPVRGITAEQLLESDW